MDFEEGIQLATNLKQIYPQDTFIVLPSTWLSNSCAGKLIFKSKGNEGIAIGKSFLHKEKPLEIQHSSNYCTL